DAFDLPVVFLCDTPGIMVGPEIEKRALVRHAARLFVVGASLSIPFCTIVLRKGYGLGAMAMAGGSFKAPLFTVEWPNGEFGVVARPLASGDQPTVTTLLGSRRSSMALGRLKTNVRFGIAGGARRIAAMSFALLIGFPTLVRATDHFTCYSTRTTSGTVGLAA